MFKNSRLIVCLLATLTIIPTPRVFANSHMGEHLAKGIDTILVALSTGILALAIVAVLLFWRAENRGIRLWSLLNATLSSFVFFVAIGVCLRLFSESLEFLTVWTGMILAPIVLLSTITLLIIGVVSRVTK